MTAHTLASRYLGALLERPGADHHPAIQWWLELARFGRGAADETPWCSAFVNFIAWQMDLPRTNSARARSWLEVGEQIRIEDAVKGNDIVVLSRTGNPAAGHVGFYHAMTPTGQVMLLGGNQSNGVTIQSFERARIVGVRRLA
jgi:uncharacterized protein (TIGR02594 family)